MFGLSTLGTALYGCTLVLGLVFLCVFLKMRVKACSAKATVTKAFVSVCLRYPR